MTTIDLLSDERFFIEQCSSCLGMFFDTHELPQFLESGVQYDQKDSDKDNSCMVKELIGEHKQVLTEVKYVKCPVCLHIMNRVGLGSKSGIIIDKCYYGQGIWLDAGKLRRLVEWKKQVEWHKSRVTDYNQMSSSLSVLSSSKLSSSREKSFSKESDSNPRVIDILRFLVGFFD